VGIVLSYNRSDNSRMEWLLVHTNHLLILSYLFVVQQKLEIEKRTLYVMDILGQNITVEI
jgi:hypothetical protein